MFSTPLNSIGTGSGSLNVSTPSNGSQILLVPSSSSIHETIRLDTVKRNLTQEFDSGDQADRLQEERIFLEYAVEELKNKKRVLEASIGDMRSELLATGPSTGATTWAHASELTTKPTVTKKEKSVKVISNRKKWQRAIRTNRLQSISFC